MTMRSEANTRMLGIKYESLFASSLAVKYYLLSVATKRQDYVNLASIYRMNVRDSSHALLEAESIVRMDCTVRAKKQQSLGIFRWQRFTM
jgi:hypothetical protein